MSKHNSTIADVENSRYRDKRIGDMTREELLEVIRWQMGHSQWQREEFMGMAELARKAIRRFP